MKPRPLPSRSAALAALDELHAEATAGIRARARGIRAEFAEEPLLRKAAERKRVVLAALKAVDWRVR